MAAAAVAVAVLMLIYPWVGWLAGENVGRFGWSVNWSIDW